MRTWSTLEELIWLYKGVMKAASWVWKTVTGSLLHITDALAGDVSELSVAINPVQNLNGYDNPWPAGGGANKLPPFDADTKTLGTTTCTFDGNGKCTLKAVADSTARTFTFDVTPFTTPTGTCYLHLLNSAANNGVTMSFRDAVDGAIGGSFSFSGTSPNKIIELTEEQKGQVVSKIRVYKNAAQTDFEITFSPMLLETNAATTTYIPYSNICPISGWTEAKIWREATYDPTADPALTIDLDGTIYGGTLDVLTGVLTVTHKGVDMGSLNYTKNTQLSGYDRFYVSVSDLLPVDNAYTKISAKSSVYTAKSLNGANTNPKAGLMGGLQTTVYFFEVAGTFADDTAFQAARTGQMFVYELATPITVQLTPAQLATLAGENNVWADTGDTTMTYMAQGG